MKLSLVLSLFFFYLSAGYAQIITTSPSIVTEDESVEIVFDASQGAGGLKNYSGDVYAHTGVITDKSTSGADWRYVKAGWSENIPACKMTNLGNNKWKLTISPSVRQFYNVPASETIQQMAFVFRSADGTKEGKDSNGKDIYVQVYPKGLSVVFTEPTANSNIILKGNTQLFTIQATQATNIKCKINNNEIASIQNSTELKTSFQFNTEGTFEITAEAGIAPNIAHDTVWIISRPPNMNEVRPAGIQPGINIINTNSVVLCLYAPYKNFVYIIGDFNDWKIDNNFLMKKDGDYWWLTLSHLEKGKEYAFQYSVNGTLKIADPYTDKILDPWNDPYIPASVYPNLKPYPAGKTEGIVSIFQTGQTPYNWKITDFQRPTKNKLIIYEMLIRDFVQEHSFSAAMQKLDYLKSLGINAIELMPVNEFEGNDSWGYNPSFYFAVDKYYGTKNDYKTFIDECHKRGIAVIMDMVLNHSYGQSPFVQLYWNSANNTPAANNPWYNITSPNQTYSWGYDFNHESAQTQALVDSVNSYWMSEYKIDGFRFDFTKGFTQKPGDGWAYDASRITILKRMTSEIYKRNANAIVIFEHLTDNSEEIELSNADIMLWGNINNNYCEGIMGYTESSKSDLSWGIYKERGFNYPNLVAYMESHDEERLMYKAETYGNSASGYNVKDIPTALKRAALSACFYLPLPGPKMIWQFGELGYDYSINTCADGTVGSDGSCRLVPKPVRWDYYDDPNRRALYNTYYKLNYLKQNYPVFSTADFNYSLKNAGKYFIWKDKDMNAFAVGNFDVKQGTVSLTLPKSGIWYEVLSGTTINATSTTYSVTLQPGEYHLYTDQPIDIPSGISLVTGENASFVIYPNPATDILHVAEQGNGIDKLEVMNLSGKIIIQEINTDNINISTLPQGLYFLKIQSEGNTGILKFIKR